MYTTFNPINSLTTRCLLIFCHNFAYPKTMALLSQLVTGVEGGRGGDWVEGSYFGVTD